MTATFLLAFILFGQNPAPAPDTGTITGRIVQSDGAPLEFQHVSALSVSDNAATVESVISSRSDHEGRYRLEGLPPGRYRIVVGAVRVPTFLPGTDKQADASIVNVVGGGTTNNVDGVLQLPAVKLSGRVIRNGPGSVGGKFGDMIAVLSADDPVIGDIFAVSVPASGLFEIPQVSPGVYRLEVAGTPDLSARTIVVGNNDITGIELKAPVDKVITGRVTLEDGGAIPSFRLRVLFVGSAHGWVPAEPTPDGAFQISLTEGSGRIGIRGIPAGFHLKSATYGGVDVLSQPITVNAVGSEEFRVTLGRGPAPGTVAVKGRVTGVGFSVSFESNETENLDLSAEIARDGTFELSSVPPGSYTAWVLTGGSVVLHSVVVSPTGVTDLTIPTPSPEADRCHCEPINEP